jgi:N-acetylglutamate synthase
MMSADDDIIIRPMKEDDYEGLITLWERAGLHYKPHGRDRRELIEKESASPQAVYLIAEKDRACVGSVLGTHDGRKGWINRLAVDPDFRRQGLARRLIQEAERRLLNRGITITACLIEEVNDASMEVFLHAGYTMHRDIVYFSKRQNTDT